MGNPICVTPDTLIFTNPNVEEISSLLKGRRVLGHDGKYHEIEIIHSRPYKGEIYRFTVNNLGISELTPEHKILALKAGRRDKFKLHTGQTPDWYAAEELRKGDIILYPIPRQDNDQKNIKFGIDIPKWDFKSRALPEEIKINNNFCRLVGYYIAEGYVRTDDCKGTIGFVFNSKEKSYIDDVLALMKKVFNVTPGKLMHNRRGTALDLPFYSARLARFFEAQFGKGAINKHLPQWMLELPLGKQKALLCGMFRGDGCIDLKRQRAKYVTISRNLAYQLRLLLLRQKIISNFSQGKAYGIHKKSFLFYIQEDNSLEKIIKIMGLDLKIRENQQIRHKSWVDDNFYYTTIRKITPLKYDGLVYNLEVEGAHSYVSNAVTLHNCGDVMKLYIKIKDGIIIDVKFKTFGCGAAVATSSMVTDLVKGKSIEEALTISNRAVAEALGGLPPIKMHCSVLAEQALRAALADYYKKIGKDPSAFAPKPDVHEHDEHY
ncbi:MAG: iron-sulfur cluster assembly scaffold protein [Candidatus Omnitrophota bacterium]|nr:iron-sulfur cluster assembly scaffold protein [Candidatus Omnitrophota bacterium]